MSEVYVNVNGTWKQASNYYVNVNGTWKEGSEIHTKVITLTSQVDNLLVYLDASSSWSYPRTGTTWIDLASTNNFTLNGPTFFSSNGGCIDFDGTDDYVERSSRLFNTNGSFTVSAWVYSDSFSGTNAYTLISNYGDTGSFQLRYKNGSGLQILESTISTLGTFTGSTLSAKNWYNITVTFNNSTNVYTLYINGSSVSTITSSETFSSNPDTIGANHSSTSEYWNGKIAQVFTFDTKLDASEVLANYNATKSNYTIVSTNLVLDLDASNTNSYSGSGTTWTDLSGQGNNATLVNSPTYSSSNGGYLSFDGTNDHATLPAIDISGNEITFSIWTFAQSDTVAALIFLGDSTDTSGWLGRQLNVHLPYSNSYYFDKGHDGTTVDRMSGSLPNSDWKNNWVNWTFTANASTGSMKIYRNGSSYASATGKTRTFNSANVDIRRIARFTNTYYDGYISKILLYKKELTASEVLQNYNATKLKYTIITTNLVLHLDTTDLSSYSGSGTSWNDLSGQGNNATLVNSPAFFTSNGGYLDFDGSNEYATLPDMDLTGNELTFSIWTYAQSDTTASLIFLGDSTAPHGNGRIINVHLPYSGNYYFDKGHDGSSSASYDRINGSLANSDWQNAWVNWAFTANASTGSMKIYRNASLYASGTGKTKTFSNSDGDMKYIAYSGNNYYDGRISKILLYKKELTASEVLHNYNIDKATYGH